MLWKADENVLNVFQRNCLRTVLATRLTDRISYSRVYKNTVHPRYLMWELASHHYLFFNVTQCYWHCRQSIVKWLSDKKGSRISLGTGVGTSVRVKCIILFKRAKLLAKGAISFANSNISLNISKEGKWTLLSIYYWHCFLQVFSLSCLGSRKKLFYTVREHTSLLFLQV